LDFIVFNTSATIVSVKDGASFVSETLKQKLTMKVILVIASMMLLLFSAPLPVANAQGENAISQGFKTSTSNISPGSLVSVVASGQNVVSTANSTNVTKLVGVAGSKPLLELSNSGENNLQVVVGGSAETLVSDLNGAIRVGDKITASPLSGIGMKAISSSEIVGTAQADLATVPSIKQMVKKRDGSSASIHIGRLPVEINVAYYTVSQSQVSPTSYLPPFLQNLANATLGREVSPLRVLVGALALLLGFIAAMVMLYSSVRSNIASIGRNPLAQHALRKGFVDVVIAAIGVLVITVIATYTILAA
jgi:hypothetical protein